MTTLYINDGVIDFEITSDQIRGGEKKPLFIDPKTIEFTNKTVHCKHEPKMYSWVGDSGLFGERTLYFCVCKECGVGTKGYHNPVAAVRAWDGNDVYTPNRIPNYKDSKLVWG